MAQGRSRLVIVVIAALSVVLGACGGGSGGASGPEGPRQMRIGVFGPDISLAAFFTGTADGGPFTRLEERYGTDISTVTIPSGSNLISALAGGSVEAAIVPGSAALATNAQGGKLVPLMNVFTGPSVMLVGDARYKAGKGQSVPAYGDARWAFSYAGSVTQLVAKSAATAAGLKWEQLERIPLGGAAQTEAVLQSDRADILCTAVSNAAAAIRGDVGYLVKNLQADADLPYAKAMLGVLATVPEFEEKYPKFTQDFVTAMVESLRMVKAAKGPEEAFELLPDTVRSELTETWDLQWDLSSSGFTRATGGFSADEVEATLRLAQAGGTVKKSYQIPEGFFDNRYVVVAYEELGVEVPDGL